MFLTSTWRGGAATALLCTLPWVFAADGAAARDKTPPTYADVLRAPDDLAIAAAYVEELIRQGRLNSAAAHVERVLLQHPGADHIRLLYIAILYRIDDIAGAHRETEILKARQLPPELQSQLERYDEAVAYRGKPTRFSLAVGSGVRYDSNRNFDPLSSDGLLLGASVPLSDEKIDDFAAVATASLLGEHDTDSQTLRRVFLGADLGVIDQFALDEYSLAYGRLQAGADIALGPIGIIATARVGGYAQDYEEAQHEIGGSIRFLTRINDNFQAFIDGDLADQWYEATELSPGSDLRDGTRLKGGGGIIMEPSDKAQFIGALRWIEKDALVQQYAFDGIELEARAQRTLPRGQYIAGRLTYVDLDYDAPDPVYSSTLTREDSTVSARLTYGVPVGTLLGFAGAKKVHPGLQRIVVQTSVDIIQQDSNIPNFEFENVGGEVMVLRRFNF